MVIIAFWEPGDTLAMQKHQKCFLFMIKLGPLKKMSSLYFQSKRIIELHDAASEISIVLDMHTALLLSCKWAASHSMTMQVIKNGHFGWDPLCRHTYFDQKKQRMHHWLRHGTGKRIVKQWICDNHTEFNHRWILNIWKQFSQTPTINFKLNLWRDCDLLV